ncbi:DNA-binding response regulator [Nostocales cyanobacterium HT-58-2]|nr:DNA-binding response regulator [Nostocales cyanobacterium HT-58-2]
MGRNTLKKILVIEAQSKTRNLFREVLETKDFDTIGAENGQVGVQLARELLPDLIICNVTLLELNGYGVLTMLRQDPVTAIIPFIFITANPAPSERRKGMQLGANDYLTQPFTIEDLLRVITIQLEKQTILRQWYAAEYQSVSKTSFADTATTAVAPQPNSNSALDPHLSEVLRFIENNYHRSISLSDVAQAVSYSPAYLTHLMRRQTGQTVQRWIIERRMAAARSLLLETDQIMEQIATQVGYNHVVHFFRQFRQMHGTTPQAWRSMHRRQFSANKIERLVSPI